MRHVNGTVGILVCIPFLLALLGGCQNGSVARDAGTLTITVTNMDAGLPGTGEFGGYLYPAGTDDTYDPESCLALFSVPIVSTEEMITLEVNDGTFTPTGEVWIGDPGWGKYDLYVLVDANLTGDVEDGSGDRTNGFPSTVVIDGNTSLVIDYNDMIVW